ncbi:peptidase M48 [Hyphomicrobium denitrificans]|uniref:peptidase M48 n=1 Tax=Hyphomicrobium denitrificans TaxID=53399 RepID=UPI00022E2B34|nr:peptidase M48 [Hyphomicrobium denitrificans]
MRRIGLLIITAAVAGLYSGMAQAQTIFDVEHARGNYRAGLVSEYDADLIRIWGAPSGQYPDSQIIDAHPLQQRTLRKQRVRVKRQNDN